MRVARVNPNLLWLLDSQQGQKTASQPVVQHLVWNPEEVCMGSRVCGFTAHVVNVVMKLYDSESAGSLLITRVCDSVPDDHPFLLQVLHVDLQRALASDLFLSHVFVVMTPQL